MTSRRRSLNINSSSNANILFPSNNMTENATTNSDAIKVICRFRPPNEKKAERRETTKQAGLPQQKINSFRLFEDGSEVEFISDLSDNKFFKFDKVFGFESTQSQVFSEVSGVVNSVMTGFNGAILAYGQTSAGKSWTMEGPSLWDINSQGIIPRCVDTLFDAINNAESVVQFQVSLSYYEIYCEKVRDLLNPQQCNLKIRETKAEGFIVQDVTEIYCTDRQDVLKVIELGKTNRASAPTLMNAESSRSHSIVSILVSQKNESSGRHKRGMLFLVDLAGSEKVSKTGASGMRLEEAKNINSSLTTLGMVINSLCDGSPHVPYRDSKLTLLLMDALGGNSKTTLIICCNPEFKHTPETLSTLRFGERAKRIKNNAKINEEYSVEELKIMLSLARKEIESLKIKLSKFMNGSQASLISSESHDMQTTSSKVIINRSNTDSDEAKEDTNIKDQDVVIADQLILIEKQTDLIDTMKMRIEGLEEELEEERENCQNAKKQAVQIVAEMETLKSTMVELEANLVKANVEARKRSSTVDEAHGKHHTLTPKTSFISPRPSIVEDGELKIRSRTTSIEPFAVQQRSNVIFPDLDESLINPVHNDDHAAGGADDKAGESPSEYIDIILDSSELDKMSVFELSEKGRNLRSTLESEINKLQLSRTISETESKSAQAAAEDYATKYIRLREDYESHIQRLMYKLTQEQQSRTHIEDRLEDALARLWRQTESNNQNKKGFLSGMFSNRRRRSATIIEDEHGGVNHNGTTTSRMSLSSSIANSLYGSNPRNMDSHPSTEREVASFSVAMNERELNLSRTLEVTQLRVSQLMAELEANKEAQLIVLETKESVMRTLVKKNSALTIENDALRRRAEDLSANVDQLTNLLKSVQSLKISVHRPSMTSRSISIQGGGRGGNHVLMTGGELNSIHPSRSTDYSNVPVGV